MHYIFRYDHAQETVRSSGQLHDRYQCFVKVSACAKGVHCETHLANPRPLPSSPLNQQAENTIEPSGLDTQASHMYGFDCGGSDSSMSTVQALLKAQLRQNRNAELFSGEHDKPPDRKWKYHSLKPIWWKQIYDLGNVVFDCTAHS